MRPCVSLDGPTWSSFALESRRSDGAAWLSVALRGPTWDGDLSEPVLWDHRLGTVKAKRRHRDADAFQGASEAPSSFAAQPGWPPWAS